MIEIQKQIADRIRNSKRMAVTSHQRPDGDSLCTALSIKLLAESLGVQVDLVNADRTPLPFNGHPEAALIRIGQIDPREYDTILLLECADVSRSGQEHIDGAYKINIDHHYSNTPYADLNWIDPTAAAVGEMVFRLVPYLGAPLTPEVAENLFCAISSDTGSFQFSNTTSSALETCAALVRAGANPVRVSERLFGNLAPGKVLLLGRVLSSLRINSGSGLAVISMFKRDTEEFGLQEVDTEDITSLARAVKGVRMVMFFKEMAPEVFRVSLRSKGSANAALVAEHFGGGGHVHASGFTVYGPFDTLVREVPATVERLLGIQAAG